MGSVVHPPLQTRPRPLQDMTSLTLQVKVKPNARVSALSQGDDGVWLAQLKAQPVDGKANKELIALIAKEFRCPKAAVTIRSGASGRMKLVKVST